MFVEAFARILQEKRLGKIGKDIFCQHMPSDAKSGILLINPNTGIDIDHELPGFYFDSFTVIVRNASVSSTLMKASAIMDIFPLEDTESENVHFRFVRPMAMPVTYPKDEGSLIEAGIPVEFAAYLLV